MARKNVQTVIARFLAGKSSPQPKERSGSDGAWANGEIGYRNALWTDGTCIFSYKMKIAERLDDGTIWLEHRDKGPSRTTKAHIDGIRWALKAEPLEAVAEERMAEIEREERETRTPAGPADWLDGEVRDRCAAE